MRTLRTLAVVALIGASAAASAANTVDIYKPTDNATVAYGQDVLVQALGSTANNNSYTFCVDDPTPSKIDAFNPNGPSYCADFYHPTNTKYADWYWQPSICNPVCGNYGQHKITVKMTDVKRTKVLAYDTITVTVPIPLASFSLTKTTNDPQHLAVGTVVSEPANPPYTVDPGINCPPGCNGVHIDFQAYIPSFFLKATPADPYSYFVGWAGSGCQTSYGEGRAYIPGGGSSASCVATFGRQTLTVTTSAGPNGSISPSGNVAVSYGGTATFGVIAASGYRIESVSVDGVLVANSVAITFTNVTANHTLSATFVKCGDVNCLTF